MNTEEPDEIMTLPEVAAYLKLSESSVYRNIRSGKIPALKVGGTWRFYRKTLEKWLEETSMANQDSEE